MPDQIPQGCIPFKSRLDKLTTELANLRQALAEADPSDRPRYQTLVGAKERDVQQARFAFESCLANPPVIITPPPPPPDTVPGVPDACVPAYRKVGKLTFEYEQLKNTLAGADPSDRERISNLLGAKDRELFAAKFDLKTCIELNTFPVFNPAPETVIPPISVDRTLTPVRKVISWSVIRKKVDEFFNMRNEAPLFKIRLHHLGSININEIQPKSGVTISKIKPTAVNGVFTAGYGQIGHANLGELASGFYFNDINSSSLSVSINSTSPEPITLKIDFETGGGTDIPTLGSASSLNLLEFSVSVKLSFDRKIITTSANEKVGRLDFFSWLDKEPPGKYIVVRVVTSEAIDPGGIFRKSALAQIHKKLSETATREKLNGIISTWMLGGQGDFDVTSLVNDGEKITLEYNVPKNILDPFPEVNHRGAGWPYLGNPQPDPKIDFSIPASMKNIKNIVVLMMENRSFDHMLGYLSLPTSAGGAGRKDVDGLKGGEYNPDKGVNHPSFPLAPGDTVFGPDAPHCFAPIYHQINAQVDANKNPIPGTEQMNGFVKSYRLDSLAGDKAPRIMGYHTAENVPVYDALVRDFGISDHYFASHPGSTFCNRFYELTGRLNLASGLNLGIKKGAWELNNSSPLTPVFTKNIFDYLTDYRNKVDKKVTWKYYEHGYSFMRFFSNYTFDETNVVSVDDPNTGFFADAKRGTLPSVSYIDPLYTEMPPLSNCDGPPADIKRGQDFVRKVVEAVITSPQYANTLLVITYDEHGGFYDHVAPPAALPYLDETANPQSPKFPVKTYGVRVPTFFISPYIKAGSVFGHKKDANGETLYFDHTSVLKTISRTFMNKNPPYMGKRYAAAKDFSVVMNSTLRRPRFLPFVGHNLVYNSKPLRLNVQGRTAASQLAAMINASDPEAQKFSFEAVGDHMYIRTFFDNKYITVDVPNGNTTMPALGFSIKQDVKYDGEKALADPAKFNVKYQLWKFTPLDTTETGKNLFTITNAFFPNLVLRPLDLLQNATPVVITKKTTSSPDLWSVNQMLLR
jgi:phospholipase C